MIVYKFNGNGARVDLGNGQLAELSETVQETKAQMEFLRDDIEKMKNEIAVKQAQKSKDEQGAILALSEQLNECKKSRKSLEQQKKNEADNIKRQKKELAAITKSNRSSAKALQSKREEFAESEQRHQSVDERQ